MLGNPELDDSELTVAVNALSDRVERTRRSVSRRTVAVGVLAAAALMAAVLALVGVYVGWTAAQKADRAVVAQCERSNESRAALRQFAELKLRSTVTDVNAWKAFVDILIAGREMTPTLQAAVDRVNAEVINPKEALIPPVRELASEDGPWADRVCS